MPIKVYYQFENLFPEIHGTLFLLYSYVRLKTPYLIGWDKFSEGQIDLNRLSLNVTLFQFKDPIHPLGGGGLEPEPTVLTHVASRQLFAGLTHRYNHLHVLSHPRAA